MSESTNIGTCTLCNKGPTELYTIFKRYPDGDLPLNVCLDCKKEHEKNLEMVRTNHELIHKIIDDAMKAKDRSVTVYFHGEHMSVSVYPLLDDEDDACFTNDDIRALNRELEGKKC